MDSDEILTWLLEGDPSIRWQVRRDLLDSRPGDVAAERERVATEGWGARLLAEQDRATGLWSGKLYSPKWVSTHYTMQLLSLLGLPQHSGQYRAGIGALLRGGLLEDGGINYSPGARDGEMCETGMLFAIAAPSLIGDERIERILSYTFEQQMPDGGWNCRRVRRNVRHASFHTTICVLEGLAAYRAAGGPRSDEALSAELRGREFLASHRLFRSHSTGEVVKSSMTMFSFPCWWYYDVLRGLDYLAAVNADRDGQFCDGIDLLFKKRTKEGIWTRQNRHGGEEWFETERAGRPSRWNTLRALRVLRWWESGYSPALASPGT